MKFVRLCKCGCGLSIAHKHPNAKFLNQRHKDKFWNRENPRGQFSHLAVWKYEERHIFDLEQ